MSDDACKIPCPWICRHNRNINSCEQCKWEMTVRFDDHVAYMLKQEREMIERRLDWKDFRDA